MKIVVAKEKCVGHARCHAVAEDLFPLDDSGYIAVTAFDVTPAQESLARRGARACPERAITIVEDDTRERKP